jgi:CDP-diacylglycerol--glycerol-3-phosphate 3-phosphatidyltransferase
LYFINQSWAGIEYKFIAVVLFLIIAGSDLVDGWLARKLNQVSNLGKLLDPLADKILIIAVLTVMVELKMVPGLAVVLIMARDLAVSLFRGIAGSQKVVIAANVWGKVKTFLQVVAVCMLILSLPQALTFLWLSVIVSWLSGAQIIWQGRAVLQAAKGTGKYNG